MRGDAPPPKPCGMRATLLVVPPLLALSACLDRGEYPSLKPRAFEIAARDATPAPPPPPAPPARPAVVARTAALLGQAREGQSSFAQELPRARAVVALAGAPDSESWITAQEQLSGLEASRVKTVTAMAELDALTLSGVDEAGLRFGDNDFAAIRAAGEQVNALLTSQQAALADLAASLPTP